MDAQVSDIIVSALQISTRDDVPEDLRVVVFSKAVDLLAAQAGAVHPTPGKSAANSVTTSAEIDGPIEAIAKKMGISADIASDIYEARDGEIVVVAAPRAFDKSKMSATKQLALVVAAGRQGAGLEESTGVDVIRGAAEEFGFLDPNNFARTLSEMDQDFIISGTSRVRQFKLRRPAWDKARELVSQLSGGAS